MTTAAASSVTGSATACAPQATSAAPTATAVNPAFDEGDQADEEVGMEQWKVVARVRPHQSDVMDLVWAPDGRKLLSASVDNTAAIWDVQSGRRVQQQLQDHKNYVQGVAWCPRGRPQLLTLSADRSCRVYEPLKKSKASGADAPFHCIVNLTRLPLADSTEKPTETPAATTIVGSADNSDRPPSEPRPAPKVRRMVAPSAL